MYNAQEKFQHHFQCIKVRTILDKLVLIADPVELLILKQQLTFFFDKSCNYIEFVIE